MVDPPGDPRAAAAPPRSAPAAPPQPAPAAPPPATPSGPPPAVPWQPPSPASAGAGGMGPLEVGAWIVGLGAVFVLGRGLTLLDGSITAFEVGRVVGSVLGAVLMGLVVRWVWVRLRKGGRVLSPWILVVATLVLLISLGRT